MKGVRYFTPNMDTQPEFGEVLKKAKAAGVKILAYVKKGDTELDIDIDMLKNLYA